MAVAASVVTVGPVTTAETVPRTSKSLPVMLLIYQVPAAPEPPHKIILKLIVEAEGTFCRSLITLKSTADCVFPAAVVVVPQVIAEPILFHVPEFILYCHIPVVLPAALLLILYAGI